MQYIRDILIDLLKIKSTSKKERKISEYIVNYLENEGFHAEVQEGDTFNVIVDASKDFFIVTHLDTIDRETSISVKNGKVCGIGSSDVKGSIAAVLCFLKKIKNLNLSIAFLGDEEEDAKGSDMFLERYRPKQAVVMEPTSMRLCTYHAGNIEILFELQSEESHGSFCEENSIDKFVEMYDKLKNLDCWKKGKYFDSCFSIQDIATDNPFYLNPGTCKGRIEIRVLPDQRAEEVARKVLEVIRTYGRGSIKELWDGFELEKDEDTVKILKQALEKANIKCEFDGMPSWTDAIKLNMKGIKVAVIGPGNLKYSHTLKECIAIEEIKKAVNFLIKLNEILGQNQFSKNT